MPSRSRVSCFASTLALTLLAASTALAAEKIQPPPLRPPEVSPQVEAAIERGLDWLASIQSEEGAFGRNRHDLRVYPTVMSSLAGIAFLASGSTPTRGPYARNIQRIRDYLLANSRGPEGLLVNDSASEDRPMYGHAFAMSFLGMLYGMESDAQRRTQIGETLREAIKLSGDVQTDDGGWGYQARFYDDEGTLTVTQTQGLRTCRDSGLLVPKRVIDNAVTYIENSSNSDGSVRYSVTNRRIRPGVTCAAVVTLWQAGRYEDPLLQRISRYIDLSIAPRWSSRNSSAWDSAEHAEFVLYYLSQVKHIQGGKEWETFYRSVSEQLLSSQQRDGSWEGRDSNRYGEVYTSCIALLVLQLPYNRLQIYQR